SFDVYPPPPALRIRYAAMPSSADTSCTATPCLPRFASGYESRRPSSLLSSSRRRHGQYRSWVSAVGVSPRLSVPPSTPVRSRRRGASLNLPASHSFFRGHASTQTPTCPPRRHQIYISRGYAREDSKGRGGGFALSERDWSKRLRLPIVRTNRIF
ncbi:hypothetical protein B0H14DRAFT_3002687, partial [Mycena olivaceomarginata]